MNDKLITVTSPLLPNLEDFYNVLKEIWDSKWITNNGSFHKRLEKELASYLKVPYVSLFTNGTLPLITALQALRISGEVITTPYSFVATTHALWWNGIKPVFVDIDWKTGCIDPNKIEAAITPKTTAIMPVHVYGKPCDTKAIQDIADKYGLKVIYDAAHAFGVEVNGESVLNFGFAGETEVVGPGINSKMDEMRSAYGLLNLKQVDAAIEARHQVAIKYRTALKDIEGIEYWDDLPGVKHNYSYFPIFVHEKEYGMTRDELYFKMREQGILGRRYFYPLISEFSTYRGLDSSRPENLPVAHKMANSVICLPMHHALSDTDVFRIIECIIKK